MRPDYKQYSIDELIDVSHSMDRELYPDRYQTVLEEIDSRGVVINKDAIDAEQSVKIETQEKLFGLIVVRLPLAALILLKAICGIIVIYFGIQLYDGVTLQEVTRKGNLITLLNSPISYYIRVCYYCVFALIGLWGLSFGIQLRK